MTDPAAGQPLAGPPDPSQPSERTRGLSVETCYRHPRVVTGVHCTRCGRPICTDCMTPAAVGYQCPECAAQAVRGAPRRRWRLRFFLGRPGSVTTTLIALNVAMFLVEVAVGASRSVYLGGNDLKLVQLGALDAGDIVLRHQYWRLFTAMFLHAGLIHLALNMYALYLFGYLIEHAFGKTRYVIMYVLCGVMASVTSFSFGPVNEVGVGASGAVFGLLGAWVAFNYRRRRSGANRFQLQWAIALIAINLVLGFSVGGIDNLAHIGGLLTGIVAGGLVEGFGPRRLRPAIQVVGLVAIATIGVVLVAHRVATLA